MKETFWQDLWEIGESAVNFHRTDIHPFVKKHATPSLLAGKRVFVPLCGKTNDMLWFREYADHVTGIEVVEKPVRQFFDENEIPFSKEGRKFKADKLTIINGDLLSLTREQVSSIDLIYDRASLVALPYDIRLRYLDKVGELTDPGSKILLITLEYDHTSSNPPFSISPADVEAYYGKTYLIQHIENLDHPHHRIKEKHGLNVLIEHAFILTKC